MRRLHACLVALLVAACCYSWAPAAAAQARPTPPGGQRRAPAPAAEPKPPAPPYVTVTKTDGTTAKGLLVASDPASITLRAPSPPGKPENEPFSLTWSEVTRVSNLLTRQKVLQQWQAEKKDQLCADCKGEGAQLCATCKGTQHDPAKLTKDCAECKGELLVDCKAPKCDHGQIPCPNRCLKLTDAGWFMKGAEKWRRFPEKGGFFEVSEHHVGELPVLKGGRYSLEPCPTCGKTTKVDCPTCPGAGKVACNTGTKNTAAPKCPDCDKGRQPCKTCEGTGMKKQPGAQ
jgi:hypothetical protein